MREKSTHSGKILKKGSQCIFLSVTLINSVFRKGKNYHCQVFLEECKYIVKEIKMPEYIADDIEIYSNDSDGEDSDDSDEENSNKESSF